MIFSIIKKTLGEKLMPNHNHQKKIALINDISGFGRCSVAVQQPVISMLKVQCCPIPTAIFSNHTGFLDFYHLDFTDYMEKYIEMWKKLGLKFNGICTGFLGSARQINIVSDFINDFKSKGTLVIVDPVMGDYGKPYPTYTKEMCEHMKELVILSDIVTPNLTEACILTGIKYREKWTKRELLALAKKVSDIGPSKVVITGIPQKTFVCNYCYEKGKEPKLLKTHKIGTSRSGTGDIFTAIIAADAINGVDFFASVKKASQFIKKCILRSIELDIPLTDGVAFEEILYKLSAK
ncbi:MAG: pyridoxamine kinase [Lachnospiraceae bacterium]|nr:pyridoxamine kinase [Lachnospiraceae bacterium]